MVFWYCPFEVLDNNVYNWHRPFDMLENRLVQYGIAECVQYAGERHVQYDIAISGQYAVNVALRFCEFIYLELGTHIALSEMCYTVDCPICDRILSIHFGGRRVWVTLFHYCICF